VGLLSIEEGVIEFVDDGPTPTFHGLLDHLTVVVGPIALTSDGSRVSAVPIEYAGMSFATRGKLVGYRGEAAPIYCSGWLEVAEKDMQASCQLEPIALAAFEPYYHGASEIRVYATTLKSTGQWSATSNQLDGRIQLQLDHLDEGDFSVRGRTILDIKKIPGHEEPRLSAEISVTGPFDSPRQWRAQFLPGDDRVQALVNRLLEYGVRIIRVPFLGYQMHISLSPSAAGALVDVETASREVREALEILAAPIPEVILEPPLRITPDSPIPLIPDIPAPLSNGQGAQPGIPGVGASTSAAAPGS
jgi:hypothetical protein